MSAEHCLPPPRISIRLLGERVSRILTREETRARSESKGERRSNPGREAGRCVKTSILKHVGNASVEGKAGPERTPGILWVPVV